METKSLPKKVTALKPYSGVGISRLDYFAHHLPHLRNRFLHLGTDETESIENLSKDLIYDLEEVLTIFYRLNLDAISFLKVLRIRSNVNFSSTKDLANYIRLSISLAKSRHARYFTEEVESFNQTFIPSVLEDIVIEMERDVPKLLEEIVPTLDVFLSRNKIDFQTLKIKEIPEKLKGIKRRMATNLEGHLNTAISELCELNYFLSTWKKALDARAIDSAIVAKLEELGKTLRPEYQKLKMLIKLSGAKD
ncbi:MAG: hypothetical protein EOO01_12615 [Chitinophagaceae bacterium]|nr:MAG: hypothetical protein EOO01_12615 [Chitinophagaceae bacterium]